MPGPAFFKALGLFIREDFFSAEECLAFIAASRVAPQLAVKVARESFSDEQLDETSRRSRRSEIAKDVEQQIVDRLAAVMPDAAQHFGVSVSRVERPQLLTYREGDFFVRHRDLDKYSESGRVVSLISFLEAPGAETYDGGALTLYTALGGEPRPIKLTPTRGLLLGFRSDVWHEVEVVTRGERHTIVSWLL